MKAASAAEVNFLKKRAPIRPNSSFGKRFRLEGLRPIVLWLPDVTSPEFVKEARRQSRAVARSPQEKEDLEFIDAISALKVE